MGDSSLLTLENGEPAETGEQAFKRIARRKLAERGYSPQEAEIKLEQLLTKDMRITLPKS